MTESDSDWCSFSTCDSNRAENLKFFSFPVHRPDLCHKWLDNCQNEKLRNLPLWLLQHHTVCELHFDKTCITEVKGRASLSKNAVPASADPPEKILNVSTTFEQRDNDSPNTTVNEMDSLDSACFVCDKTITSDKWKYKLKTTATKKRKVPVSDLIQLLVGDDFEVLVGERDAVCSDCMKSLNDMDALTDQLANVKVGLSRLLNLKYNLTSDDPEVGLDGSKIEDREPTLQCKLCSFHANYDKELICHVISHFAAPKASNEKEAAVSSPSNLKNKANVAKKRIYKIKKKPKIVFQCSLCETVCEDKLEFKIHAVTVHRNVNIVLSDSEEYGDVETLEQSGDELCCNNSQIKKEPVSHDSGGKYEDLVTLEQSNDELPVNGRSVQNELISHENEKEHEDLLTLEQLNDELPVHGRSVQNELVAHDSEGEYEDFVTLDQSNDELPVNGRSVQIEHVPHDSEGEYEDFVTLEQSNDELPVNGRSVQNEHVAHDSEGEYEDFVTLEQSNDELPVNGRSVQNEHVAHDSEGEYEDFVALEQSNDELPVNGRSVQNEHVAHDSEYEDIESLEETGDELTRNFRSIKTKPGVQELDCFDDWEDDEVISNPKYWKADEESSLKAVLYHTKQTENRNYSNLKLAAPKQPTSISGANAFSTTVENASYIYSNQNSLKQAFKCNFCGLRKVCFDFIKKHTYKHKRKMSLQCKLCGSRFKRNSGIKIHQFKCRKISSVTKKCILCPFRFFNGTALKRHFKNVHLRTIETNETLFGSNKNTLNKLNRFTLKIRCEQCGVLTEKNRLGDHESKHRIQHCLDYNICICCNKIFVDRVHLDIHTENMHPDWFSGKECSVCKRDFPNNGSLQSHYLRYHITDISSDLVRRITEYNKSLKENGKAWKNLQGFIEDVNDSHKHLPQYNPLVYNCPIKSCMFQSKNDVLMKKHATKHEKNYCHICKSLFRNEIFDYHMKHHSKTFLGRKCTLCNSLFHDFIHLMYHKESTHQSKCNMCSQPFFKENLAQHVDKVHRKKFTRAFTCIKCHIVFQSRKSLNDHNKLLHCLTLHCRYCDKSFDSLKILSQHKQSHINEIKTTLKCTLCGKVCKSRDALKIHKARHQANLRPQRCDTCLMHFESFFDLKEHVVTHLDSEEKKYFCDICEKGFYFYQCYRRHLDEH